ncbi:17055_t:CDS:2, partial [Rhizophagus irregularis]
MRKLDQLERNVTVCLQDTKTRLVKHTIKPSDYDETHTPGPAKTELLLVIKNGPIPLSWSPLPLHVELKEKYLPFEPQQFLYSNSEQNDEKNEPHYRATLVYSYPSELDNVESEKVKEMLLMLCPILGLGANNAIQDDKLSQALLKYTDDNISFIKEYEKEMLKRTSAD